jgi:hypothetical protein
LRRTLAILHQHGLCIHLPTTHGMHATFTPNDFWKGAYESSTSASTAFISNFRIWTSTWSTPSSPTHSLLHRRSATSSTTSWTTSLQPQPSSEFQAFGFRLHQRESSFRIMHLMFIFSFHAAINIFTEKSVRGYPMSGRLPGNAFFLFPFLWKDRRGKMIK